MTEGAWEGEWEGSPAQLRQQQYEARRRQASFATDLADARANALYDVNDPERFIRATIQKRKGKPLDPDLREELVREGLVAIVKLADIYQPGFGGRDAEGSTFSGFCAKFLPGKLEDALHRLNGDTLAVLPDGSREWRYAEHPSSLDALEQTDTVTALRAADQQLAHEQLAALREALRQTVDADLALAEKVGVMLLAGYAEADIAMELRAPASRMTVAVSIVKRSAHRLRSLEAA